MAKAGESERRGSGRFGNWRRLSSRTAYRNPWIRVREDQVIRPDGNRGVYGVVETKGPCVYIVALTPRSEVILTKQYRYPTRRWSWELPGGNSDGQRPLVAAKRELQEETGYTARRWRKIGTFQTTPGMCSEISHVFIARGIRPAASDKRAAEGITAVKPIPFATALRWVHAGRITDCQSVAALLHAALNLRRIRA